MLTLEQLENQEKALIAQHGEALNKLRAAQEHVTKIAGAVEFVRGQMQLVKQQAAKLIEGGTQAEIRDEAAVVEADAAKGERPPLSSPVDESGRETLMQMAPAELSE